MVYRSEPEDIENRLYAPTPLLSTDTVIALPVRD